MGINSCEAVNAFLTTSAAAKQSITYEHLTS